MLKLFRSRKAQNTAEYAIMIVIVIGVFSAMQLYIRRGLQARIKGGMDNIVTGTLPSNIGMSNAFGSLRQYEPYYSAQGTSNMSQVTEEGTERGAISQAGGVRELGNAISSRNGYQTMVGINAAD